MNGTHKQTQVPPGVQCFVGDEARRRRRIEEAVVSVFEGWDYEEIIPPLFDYADVFTGEALAPKTYSFIGRDGSVLALRPDFTSLLAKIAAGRLRDRKAPLRLYYSGEVVRFEPPKAGRPERAAPDGARAPGRRGARRPTPRCWRSPPSASSAPASRTGCWRSATSGVFNGLVEGAGLDPARVELLRERVEAKDAAGVREALSGSELRTAAADAIERLTSLAGGPEVLDEAERVLAQCASASAALGELRGVVRVLEAAGLGGRLAVDLGEVRGLDYYTGLVFRVVRPRARLRGRRRRALRRPARPLRPAAAGGRLHARPRPSGAAARAPGRPRSSCRRARPSRSAGRTSRGPSSSRATRRAAGGRVRFGNGEEQ